MYHIDFNKPIHVHFIGIGGISMSGLADILLDKGFEISGSDMKQSALTDGLTAKGVRVAIGQTAENITDGIDLVVYTAAISHDNPELTEVLRRDIPMLTRAELLGEIMANYRVAIGVSGTHGKTTTTSMLTEMLISAELDPTVTVGGILPSIGGNLRIGKSDNFITEACEYTNSFLSFCPTVGIILNVQEDHMDFFKDIDDIRNSFRRYANLLPADGLLVINGGIDNYGYISGEAACPVITFGESPECDYTAADICYNETGCCTYTPVCRGISGERIELGVPGLHNVYNSLAALAVADWLGCDRDITAAALKNFAGTERRFQKKGVTGGFTVIDDYAHHPAEIDATINSALNYPHRRIVCVFQPHTYTRTAAFLKDFAKSLSRADIVILADIYAARERNTIGISSKDLKAEIDSLGTECIYEPDFDKIKDIIKNTCREGDLVLTVGAGNIVEVGEALLQNC